MFDLSLRSRTRECQLPGVEAPLVVLVSFMMCSEMCLLAIVDLKWADHTHTHLFM